MDRLLELLLRRFVRRGTLRFTTARRLRFHGRRRQRPAGRDPLHDQGRPARRAARSRDQARRSLHGRHACVVEEGTIADLLAHRARPDERRTAAGLGAAAMAACATSIAGCSSSTCRSARAATSRTITISTAGSTRCSSTPTGNTPAPISSRPTSRSTTRSSPRSAISRPSCCSTPGAARARHRLRLGRPCALSRGVLRRQRHRHHAVAGAVAASPPSAPPRRTSRGTVEFRLQDYRDVRRDSSTASSRSACSSTSASASTTRSSASAPSCSPTTASMLLHSIGRSEGPNVTNPWIAKYIFPGGYIPALSEVLPAIERARPARHRHRNPAAALRRDAEGLARALPGASRGGRAHLRPAFRADVGVLSRRVRDGVPRAGHDGDPDPAHQAPGRRADHARLHRARGGAAARARSAASARRCGSPANSSHRQRCSAAVKHRAVIRSPMQDRAVGNGDSRDIAPAHCGAGAKPCVRAAIGRPCRTYAESASM